MALELTAEERDILVADSRADTLDGRGAVLQQILGRRHAQHLNVATRPAAGRGLEVADEIARPHSDAAGESVDRHIAIGMLLQVLLGLPDPLVGVRTRQWHHRITGLSVARHADEQGLGALHRDFLAAELLDQIKAEIDRAVDATAADQAIVLRYKLFGSPANLGIALSQSESLPLSRAPCMRTAAPPAIPARQRRSITCLQSSDR
jgi:hypothetical protein